MRAVNLIPADARRGGGLGGRPQGPAYGLIAGLVVALALVTVYVLTTNTISSRTATLASLQAQTAQAHARAASFAGYTAFEHLAQTRAATVRQIAASRFDWHGALSDLARVVPANTSLQSLSGSVSSGAGGQGATSPGAAGGLQAAGSGPAFELIGCTSSQDDVARLISRLRLINGVTRVTLSGSQKSDSAASGSSAPSSGSSTAAGCGPNGPTFDLFVSFAAPPGAGATGGTASSSTAAVTAAPSSQPGTPTTGTGPSR